jgi:hypothetical protein
LTIRVYVWLCFNVEWGAANVSQYLLCLTEAEFSAASSMVQEVIFLRKFLDNLDFKQNSPTPLFADNETCIHLSKGSVGGSNRAKHIDLSKHFGHDACQQGILQLWKNPGRLTSNSMVQIS